MNLEKEDKIIRDRLYEYIEFDAFDKHKVWNRIENQLSNSKEKKFPLLRYVSIAALLLLFLGAYFATIQLKNKFQTVTNKMSLVKVEPHSVNTDPRNSILSRLSSKHTKKGKVFIVKQTTKKHFNISNNSSVVSTKSLSNDIQESILGKTNSLKVLESQASINSDSKAISISTPLAIVNTKNIGPKRKYTIIHINELERSNESILLHNTGANEKIVNALYQQNNFKEQQDVQKYLTIKLNLNKSINSLNDNDEK